MATSGVPRPVPSSLASKPSARRECVTNVSLSTSILLCPPPLRHRATTGSCPRLSPPLSTPRPLLVRLGAVGWVTPCPASRLGAISRRMLSNSSSISAGSVPSPKQKTTNKRARRWAKPKYWASRMRHAAVPRGPVATPALLHPAVGAMASSAPISPAKKQPKALSAVESIPGTFSHKTARGLTACTISTKRKVKFPR